MMGAKVHSTCPLAHEQLSVTRAQKGFKTIPYTNVLMKCPVRMCGKWVCSYVLGDHIRESHPMGPPALISAEERAAVLAALSRGHRAGRTDPVTVPVPEFTASSHVPATSVVCSNNGSSSSSNSSSSSSSSDSGNSSSSNTSGTSSSELVPSDVGDVLPQQVVRKRAISKTAGKEKKARRFGEWEDDSEPAPVAKRRPPSEAAADRAAELQAAQRRAQWAAWTTYALQVRQEGLCVPIWRHPFLA